MRPLGPIQGASNPPAAIRVTGRRLLLEVGKACARSTDLEDPGRLFALLKYSQALLVRGGSLSLSEDLRTLDSHKKAVLSDELGCGLAFLVAGVLFRARRFCDFETAIRTRVVRTTAKRRDRPDYIADTPAGMVVIEAKGTQSGRAHSRRQVTRGCQQVSRVRVLRVRGSSVNILSRIAVGTALSFQGSARPTIAHIGDPEEHEPVDYEFTMDPESAASLFHYLRVAALVGDGALVTRMSTHGRADAVAGTPVRRVVNGRDFLGSEVVLEGGGAEAGFFVGLAADLREQLMSRDIVALGRDLAVRERETMDEDVAPVERTDSLEPHDKVGPDDLPTAPSEHGVEAGDGSVLVTWLTQ